MSFTFRPAVRENVPLIIGLIGGTGSGKTVSGLELATGLAGGKPFCGIDTESGRMKHYADHYKFDHGDLGPPFRPDRYIEAIVAADKAGYPVVIVDSTSHVWAGTGGVLDWHEEELQRMAGEDWKKREACNMAAWIKPKMSHKSMVQRLLQLRCHLILCFRAEPKVEMTKKDGKWEIVPKVTKTGKDGWVPVCEKNLPFELTMSFLLTDDAPGVPLPIKLERDHRPMVPLDTPLSREVGVKLAAWAAGGKAPPASESEHAIGLISDDQAAHLRRLCRTGGVSLDKFLEVGELGDVRDLPAADYAKAVKWIEKRFDEAVTLRLIDKATDEGEGAAILELCKTLPFHKRAVEAFNNRFQQR